MDSPQQQLEVSGDVALWTLGLLRGAEARKIEGRLHGGCDFCLSEAAHYDRVAGEAMAAMVTPVAPAASLKDRLMARLAPEPAGAEVPGMVLVRGGETGWRRGPAPGTRVKFLKDRSTLLLEMDAGAVVPPHDHDHAAEQCLVVSGTVRSGALQMAAGDYIFMPKGSHHDALETDDGCLLLISYA